MNTEAVYVIGLGASTPVGRDPYASAAAVRAGISGLGEHPYAVDTTGEPMCVAVAPWLDIEIGGIERLEALLYPAIDQALEPIQSTASNASIRAALALGLPSPRPGLATDLQARLANALSARYDDRFVVTTFFPNGHASGLLALEAAQKKLVSAGLDACVVAGVDSYIEAETLDWLEAGEQVHGAGELNNAWGFIPGEAAGAVLLMRSGVLETFGHLALARVLGVGTAIEPNRIKTDTVCIGEGLTQAFRGALRALPVGHMVTDIYCDMNGEPYRADEYGFTCLRTKEAFESASDFVAPADCWGDVSAASGPLHIALATIAGRGGYARGPSAFAWGSSETGERAAALLWVGPGDQNADHH